MKPPKNSDHNEESQKVRKDDELNEYGEEADGIRRSRERTTGGWLVVVVLAIGVWGFIFAVAWGHDGPGFDQVARSSRTSTSVTASSVNIDCKASSTYMAQPNSDRLLSISRFGRCQGNPPISNEGHL